jgi:hypothetical protein
MAMGARIPEMMIFFMSIGFISCKYNQFNDTDCTWILRPPCFGIFFGYLSYKM